jgi:hypothetical protein
VEDEVWLCPLCNSKLETANHIFLGRDIARIIWRHSNLPLNVEAFVNLHTSSWIKAIITPKFLAIPKKEIYNFQILTLFLRIKIWLFRNQKGHNSSSVF